MPRRAVYALLTWPVYGTLVAVVEVDLALDLGAVFFVVRVVVGRVVVSGFRLAVVVLGVPFVAAARRLDVVPSVVVVVVVECTAGVVSVAVVTSLLATDWGVAAAALRGMACVQFNQCGIQRRKDRRCEAHHKWLAS